MTLKNSLGDNTFRHTFRYAIRKNILFTIISTIVLILFIPLPPLMEHIDNNLTIFNSNGLIYQFGINPHDPYNILLPIFYLSMVVFIGIMQAILVYRFAFKKSDTNAYFSLGIKRKQLFTAHFLAGALHIVITILIPMVLATFINILISQDVLQMLLYSFYITLGLIVTTLVAFTIASLVCAVTYTLKEGLVYSILGYFTPSMLLIALNGFMIAFLWGSPFGRYNYYYRIDHEHLLLKLSAFNPFMFFSKYYHTYYNCGSHMNYENLNFNTPYLPILIWLVIGVGLFFAARWLFTIRKTENTAQTGANKKFSAIMVGIVFVTSFTTFLYFARIATPVHIFWAIVYGLLLALILSLLFALPLKLIEKKKMKWLLSYPVYIGICALVIVIMLSGFFGYTKHIPKIDNIKSVEISYRGLPDTFVNGTNRCSNALTFMENNKSILLEDKNDIQIALGLHDKLANQGYQKTWDEYSLHNKVSIKYRLNNNRTIYRYYNHITHENLKEMLVLDETQGFRDAFYEQLDTPCPHSAYDLFRKNDIYVSDTLSDELIQIASEPKVAQEIKQAIKKDYENLHYTDRYFPKQKDKYILYFISDDSNIPYPELDSDYEKLMYQNYTRMVIDPSYTNTIKVIEKYYTPPENEIEKIRVLGKFRHCYNLHYTNCSPFFIASLHDGSFDNTHFIERLVTDTDTISELYESSRGIYHVSDDGYVIYIKVKDKDYTVARYVPKDLMPEKYKKMFD